MEIKNTENKENKNVQHFEEKSDIQSVKFFKKPSHLANKLSVQIALRICKFFGHRWIYKDYTQYIQADGNKYPFKASRSCTRCNLHAYFYSGWKVEPKSKIDFEGNYYSVTTVVIDNILYK